MKTQTVFQNASLISVVNGSIVVKDSTGREHTFANASVVSVNNGTIVIESEWKPKEGELVKMEGNGTNCYAIFKNIEGSFLHDYGYRFFRENQLICNPYGWDARNVTISPVTPEEIQELDDQLAAKGMQWNPDTMQVEKLRWKPKTGEYYFAIITSLGHFEITHYIWTDDLFDTNLYKTNNCFKTQEEAKVKLEQIKKLLLEV